MIRFEQTGVIHAPLENVFACVADPKRIPEWRTDVPGISGATGKMKQGQLFYEEVHFMGKKQLAMRVTEFRENEKIVIEAQSGMKLLPTQTFIFHRQNDTTRVELSVQMKTSGFFRLMEPMLAGKLKKVWADYFKNLDRLLRV